MNTPKEYYKENGYYVFQQLIPHNLIDNLLKQYSQDILPSKTPFFRQSTNRWETSKISEYGYAEESFLNVHDYPNHTVFCEAVRQILCSQDVREALTQLTESEAHNLMQSMLFDMNTATPAHQDWYYLDSLPNGYLLAGWFALEDIYEEAGQFYVLPKSHRLDFDLTDDEKISNAPYVRKLKEYVASHKNDIHAPTLKKGDVLFWNSRTVHGSLETINPKYSRKSLTAHYLPSQYHFGARYEESPRKMNYGTYAGMKYALVLPDIKHYSVPAKIKTDLTNLAWNQPTLARMLQFVKKQKKVLLKN